MTPAERTLIDRCLNWVCGDNVMDSREIATAALAVKAERTSGASGERLRKWSEVVTEDEIYSTKTKKWYRVVSTGLTDGVDRTPDKGMGERKPTVKVQCEGMAKPFTVPATAEVLVRRSEMGQAVDMWIDVMRSGPA